MPVTSVVWFRADLRVADHPALSSAATSGDVACLFVVDPGILGRRHHHAPNRLRFLRAGLEALDSALREVGGALIIRVGDPADVVPAFAREVDATRVHATRSVSPRGRERDDRVAAALARAGHELVWFGGDLVVDPHELPGPAEAGYKVFTPFYKAWMMKPTPPHQPAPTSLTAPDVPSDGLGALPGGDPLIPAGPDAARERLVAFIRSRGADAYGTNRNALADDGTSRLSAYLRFGMVTGAQIGRALGLPAELPAGRAAFWRQIAWREFYQHLLWWHPHMARDSFQERYRRMRWDNDPEHISAWSDGRTGYPIVDAGMRQLRETGWMHNRARMIVASFLVKDLLVDWRVGERVFMQHLLDGDPANNNGGWQWTAGTGTDAAPYFRVFNPVLQGKKFDPDGAYVRRYVPELREVPQRRIHEPWTMSDAEQQEAGCRIGADYPAPIVDHHERRALVLDRYKETEPAT